MGRRTNFSKRKKDIGVEGFITANPNSMRHVINKLLLKHRATGLTINAMLDLAMEDYGIELNDSSFAITVCKYHKSGYLIQEKVKCKCCHDLRTVYTLSENALLSIQDSMPIPDDFISQLEGLKV